MFDWAGLVHWLLSPIDPGRGHSVAPLIAWHGRLMVLAWAVLAPLAILAARYYKIMPRQNWPKVLDNPLWWRVHWKMQVMVVVFSMLALGLAVASQPGGASFRLHWVAGYSLLALLAVQVGFGIQRGSKGGPTAPAPDGSFRGDHYDMTPYRLAFERVHKTCGYLAVILSVWVIAMGLWAANSPIWMWLSIGGWWISLILTGVFLQITRGAADTYQAIWGPSLDHPGNRMKKQGFLTFRPGDTCQFKDDA